MLTEEEARKKWCPASRASNANLTAGVNRRPSNKVDPDCYCIASDCMAWRWQPAYPPAAKDERQGFCGLAGAPQ
mgnify:CR=1 FL=1